MKTFSKISLIVFSLLALASCKKDELEEQNPIQITPSETYKLVETLADPGDGSGTFQPVTSNKTIQLFADGTFTANGDVCSMNVDASLSSSGTYVVQDSIISPDSCNTMPLSIIGNELIITYFCIEGCKAKYLKQ